MNAMITLGIENTQRFEICRVLAAILHIGQIEWQQHHHGGSNVDESTPCMPSDENRFILVAKLLGLHPEDFLKAVTVQTRRLPGNNVVLSPVSPQQCSNNLASISRYCYSIIFEWIICKINSSISPKRDAKQDTQYPLRWVSVLDIFGFESFDHRNSLEQFLVNFANERLQLCFTQRVFELEKKVYDAEGLSGDNLAAEVVNYAPVEPLLRVLQGPNYGCISHIESACLLQTGTDQSIINAFTKAGYPLDLLTTAGSVTYNINGFRDKNMDRLSDDLYALISHTSNDVLKEAVAVASPSSEGAPQQQQGGGARRSAYIAQKFVHSIDSLMAMLDPTEAFFVRCVKPNTQKKPRLYNSRNVVRQLHSLSVFHAIKMSSCGYCFRLPFRQFIHRYHPLRFLKDTSTAPAAGANDDALLMAIGDGHGEEGQEECSHLLKRFLGDDDMKGAVLGKTMVLARKECHMVLEKSLSWVLSDILGPIATTIRKTLDHKRAFEKFIIRSSRLVTIQSMLRSYLIRRTEMQRIQYRRSLITVALLQRKVYMFLVARAAAMQLQTASRNLLGMLSYERRRKNLEVMNASSVLQSYGRAALSRVRYERRKESRIKDRAARLIQGAMRKAYTRRSYAKNWVWRMLVWPMKRHYQVKVDAALFIQSVWRAHIARRQNPHVLKMIQVARERVWRRVMVEEAKGLLTAVIQGFILRATMGRYTQAAIVIQTRIRGILRPRWMRLRLSSAIKIQSLWRAYVVR
ncbi:Unconventional myosin-Ig, partial [Perkinsus olseni]